MSTSSTNTIGKYQIIREIARSNDIVYEALDPSINRRVALKELCIPPNLQGAQRRERIERFWREGKAAGRLSHPNIVTIFEVGKDGDRHFIAMEYLEGQTLRDTLQAGGPMPIQTVENYVLQLCDALSYAHKNGVVHRDIKPDNVQILPGGHIKLTDFGIARLMGEPSITQDGQVFGTPSYMSPEQVAGKNIDARSDIFSLGVLIYEMIAGKKPFTGDGVVTITYNIMNMEPPPPPGAPPYMISIIRKAMAKDQNSRYQSIDDLVQDLRDQKVGNGFLPDPSSTTGYPSPFGGAAQAPQQQSQVPITPYGTPIPSPTAGSVSGSVPDPFVQKLPTPPPIYNPPKSILSSETRNFLGIFLIVIGLVGMLAFAIWAISLAYNSYATAQTSGIAARYYEQGLKLYAKSDLDGAEQQFQNAVRISPRSKYAEKAKDGIYKTWIARAYNYATANNKEALMDQARKMVEDAPTAPEGHYYLGLASEMTKDSQTAAKEYELASRYAGNDQEGYGKAARARLDYINSTNAGSSATPPSEPQPQPQAPQGGSDIPFLPGSQ